MLRTALGATPATNTDFGMLPNAVARDTRVSPELLVVLAYRLTFADKQSHYGLSERRVCNGQDGGGGSIVRTGLCGDVFRRALALGDELGPLKRWQPAGKAGRFRFAEDRLTLPPCGATGFAGSRLYREWFDGSLSLKELAVLLFRRAGTGKGSGTTRRELQARFGWSKRRRWT